MLNEGKPTVCATDGLGNALLRPGVGDLCNQRCWILPRQLRAARHKGSVHRDCANFIELARSCIEATITWKALGEFHDLLTRSKREESTTLIAFPLCRDVVAAHPERQQFPTDEYPDYPILRPPASSLRRHLSLRRGPAETAASRKHTEHPQKHRCPSVLRPQLPRGTRQPAGLLLLRPVMQLGVNCCKARSARGRNMSSS